MAQLVIEWRKNPTPTSAAIFLQSLNDLHKSFDEKLFILDNLDDWRVITATWFEMARFIDIIGGLSCDSQFTELGRNKAALICSKIAYCLEEYNKALVYALASGKLFNLTPKEEDFHGHDSLYVNKIIQQALDTYKQMRYEKKNTSKELDDLVDRIFKQNLEVQDYTSVVGLALDTRRIDMVSKAIEAQNANDTTTVLTETLNKVWQSQLDIEFRGKVLDLIFNLFENQAEAKDAQKMSMKVNSMCQCLIKLDRSQHVAKIIEHLLTTENVLVAYQLAFDLHENAPQQFLGQLKQELFSNKGDGDQPVGEVKKNLQHILEGEETIKHHMQFLIKNNHTDMLILRQIKDSVRGVCAHNAAVLANGLMHTGTTCDDFLRENLDWISKATNWNKFNAVASLGLIHKGHEREAKKILDPYLPKGDQDQFGYKEGGSLYAYGLIHANHGNQAVIQYLTEQLTKATTSAVRHGACLALGLAALGTRNQNVYEQLREILYQNEAVSGEAAGTAMGLVMAGSMDENAFNEMRQYILDTQHDKIQRGLRTGIAMLAYGALDKSEQWIAILEENNSEAILRQTAVCMLAMAYAGSGKADVISRLLAKVAMDPSNDVKRFGAIAVGFILSGDPELCLMYTDMLVEHFNGHIRYGAAIALAIASAGSGYKESISRLEPLLQAKENYVRQGALIALSFILIQQTASTCPNVVEFRKNIMKMITEKGEDTITKFGAIIAQGILDAGGRNVTLSLHNREGQPDMPAVLGTFVFLQHWYWHSMTHFISLAFRPTCLIGLNKDLKMPKIEFRCNSKPSHFAYPPPLEEKKKENTGKVETAILSIAGKKKGLAAAIAKKKDESTETKMEVDENKSAKEEANQEEKPKEMPEPLFHNISNPARVVRLQLRKLSMVDSARYAPIKQITQGGIVMFENLKAEDEEEIVELAIAGGVTGEAETKENKVIDPHTPFEFTLANY